jgi:hypothetical protein
LDSLVLLPIYMGKTGICRSEFSPRKVVTGFRLSLAGDYRENQLNRDAGFFGAPFELTPFLPAAGWLPLN